MSNAASGLHNINRSDDKHKYKDKDKHKLSRETKKTRGGLPFLSKVPVGATSKHLVHQSLVFRVLLEQLVLKKEMHWFKCLSNEIKSEILRLEKLEYQIGFCTPAPSSKEIYI